MMKKNFKVITLVVSLLLLMGAVIGISAFAEETAPSIEIVRKNVSYEGAVKTLFVIDTENAEGYTIKVNFYDVNPEAEGAELKYTKGVDGKTTIDGVEYDVVFSKGIAPANLRKSIYAVPVLVDSEGNVVVQGETVEYSPYIYALNRFEKSPTEDQTTLYSALLDYGAAVQRLLCKPEDVAANGGYADEYCGIREDVALNGVRKETGNVKYYAPGEEVTLTASNMYGTTGVFHHFSDESNVSLGDGAYTKKTITATKPGVSVYTENYIVTGQTFNTYDDLCIDGSANDVNILYKGIKENSEATNALGFTMLHNTFGNTNADLRYTRIDVDSTNENNKVIAGGHNGGAGNNNAAWHLDQAITDTDNIYKYVAQLDFKWDGLQVASPVSVWFRFKTESFEDAYDYVVSYVYDPGNTSDTYTIRPYNGSADYEVTLNKGQWYTLRFEIMPNDNTTFNFHMYVDGELKAEKENMAPKGESAKGNANKFLGFVMFNRSATKYTYEIDNTYVGYEGDYFSNENISGTRFEYDGITPVTDNIFTSDSDVGDAFKSSVVDGKLCFEGEGVNIGLQNNGNKTGDSYVFETDLMLDGSSKVNAANNMAWFGMSASGVTKDNYFLYLRFVYDPDDAGNIKQVRIVDQSTSVGTVATLNRGEMYKLRFVYTIDNVYNDDGTLNRYRGDVKIYVNNELVSTYKTVGAGGTVSNEQFNCVGFEIRPYSSSNIKEMTYCLDNTFIGAVSEAE